MRSSPLAFPGWPGGARALAPELFARRDAAVERQFDFLLRVFTPRSVFLEIGSADCELALRAAGYVERVWCVDAGCGLSRPPSNLRLAAMDRIAAGSVDVAFSESLRNLEAIRRVLSPRGIYFVQGRHQPARMFRKAGFSKVQYFAGNLRLPAALARISRSATTAAFR